MNQERTELLVEAMGLQGLGWEGEGFTKDELAVPRAMLRAKGNSIEGGTSEVNLNVVAKRVLGLAGSPVSKRRETHDRVLVRLRLHLFSYPAAMRVEGHGRAARAWPWRGGRSCWGRCSMTSRA
jgi:hypothetical protein